MSVSIITVNYNSGDSLKKLIESLLPQMRAGDETIVVDNASADDSIARIGGYKDSLKIIMNMENAGFSKAVNRGAEEAGGDYILLVNPDAIVSDGAVAELERFMAERPEAGIAGGRVLECDGTLQLACRRGFPTPWVAFCRFSGLCFAFPRSRAFARYNLTFLNENEASEVDAVSGSFMMIRREAFEGLGGFDEDYFLYAEDIDFCYRAKQAGWKVYYHPGSVVTHAKGVCASKNPGRASYEFYNTMWTFHNKHFRSRTPAPLNACIYLAVWVMKLAAPRLAVLKSGARRKREPVSDYIEDEY